MDEPEHDLMSLDPATCARGEREPGLDVMGRLELVVFQSDAERLAHQQTRNSEKAPERGRDPRLELAYLPEAGTAHANRRALAYPSGSSLNAEVRSGTPAIAVVRVEPELVAGIGDEVDCPRRGS